jgi:SAM-dependent methyltransferase
LFEGAGTGGATKAIFREIGKTFRSYTYTDISAAFFEKAADIFPTQRDRMVFKTFDAEKEPEQQGFVEGTYDLIVAFFVIHATGDLERALKHIRKLLKPGGFLVVGEGQEGMNGVASSGFIFGTLPGWWFGADKGRTYSPHVSPKEWNELLKRTGFSGVDSATPAPFEDVLNVYHFVSQAVDEETNYFREPLAVTTWKAPPIRKLVVIGGETSRSSHLVEGVLKIIKRDFATEVYHFNNLLDIDHEIVDADSTIISLTELDSPVFKDITSQRFDSLRKVFESEKTILWITSGRRDDEPYSNMTVGFGRVAANETPELRLQHLDIAEPENTTPETIAEILLRLHASAFTKNERLQPVEPEIIIDDKQMELVSRLRPIPELNNRYNSVSRSITQEADIEKFPVSLEFNPTGCVFKELSKYDISTSVEETIELRTKHAISSALTTPFGPKFLVLGLQAGTGIAYLALVPSLASILRVPSKSAVRCEIPPESAGALLTTISSHLISMTVVDPLYSGQSLLVHNANSTMAQALAVQAEAKNVTVVYTVDTTDNEISDSWIKLPRYVTQPELSEILLETPSSFVGFSSPSIETSENESALIACLPADCHVTTAETVYSSTGSMSNRYASEPLGERLQLALKFSMVDMKREAHTSLTIPSVNLESLAAGVPLNDPLSIVDFTSATDLPIQVARLDTSPMFKGKDSTYWIVGMSGALGISLCDWMITRGARNIVLTTRNPKVEPEWIAAHKRRGATVTILPWYV